MNVDISVVIVNWNVGALVAACLRSIQRFTDGVSFDITVVDNASTDGSAALIRSRFPDVRLIENERNRGFAAANNQALPACGGRYILFLNPDTELIDNALKKMTDFMDAHPEADGLGCRLVYGDRSLQRSCRHFPSPGIDLMESLYLDGLFPRNPFFNRYRMGGWAHDDTREVDQPYGACLTVRRSALDRVGVFDENLFMYYDEVDLCYRIKKTGGRIFFTDTITVVHHANKSSSQVVEACERYKHASRLRFFAKHYGRWAPWLMTLHLAVRTFLVWIVFGLGHLLVGRPRDPEFFKKPVRIMWSETMRFFRKGYSA